MARKSRKNLDTAPVEVISRQCTYSAARYIRLSSDDTKKRGDSLDTQTNIIENYVAASPDIQIVETYSDNNVSGTIFARQGFQRMLADVENGKINCIIVKDLSRLGRNAIDTGYYIEKYFPMHEVRFIAVTDNFDSNESDGGIVLPLKNIINETYALDISRKCRSVQQQNIKDGRFVGRMAPYGFAKSPEDCHKLIIDEEAAANVRQMFDWIESGMTVGDVVRSLNESGLLPPSHYKRDKGIIENEKLIGNSFWQKCNVNGILADRVYIGDMVQGKSRTINHKEFRVPPEEWICVENTHDAVISREQFDKVQTMLKQAAESILSARRKSEPYTQPILKGKVLCAHCGQLMHRHRQNKDNVYWYRCESQWKIHKSACVQVSVKETELVSGIVALIHKQTEAIVGRYVAPLRHEDTLYSKELSEINRKLNESGRYRQSLYENYLGGVITSEEFTMMQDDYTAQIEGFSQRADDIRHLQREKKLTLSEFNDTADALSCVLNGGKLNTDTIDRLVEKIIVRRDKSFDIALRYADEFQEVRRVG